MPQGMSATFTRNGVPELSFSLSHDDAGCEVLLTAYKNGTGGGPPTLAVYRTNASGTNVLIFNGYLATVSEESGVDASTATFTFRGPFGRLLGEGSNRGRFLTIPASFTAIDAGTIATNLLNARIITASDDFIGMVGSLNGRAAPLGGSWVTGGAATDFAAGTLIGAADVERSTTSDSGGFLGRTAIIGSASYVDTAAQLDFVYSSASTAAASGLLLRYIDANNWVQLSNTSGDLRIVKQVGGGAPAIIASSPLPGTPGGSVATISGSITAAGLATVTLSGITVSVTDPDLANGGALGSGKPGFYDYVTGVAGLTRAYTRFSHSTAAAASPHGVGIGTIEPTKKRDRTYPAQTNTGEAIVALSAISGGFDFEVAPVSQGTTLGLFNVYARQGTDRPGAKFEYGPGTLANCLSMHRQTLPPINAVTVVGANGLVSVKTDAASIAKYGRCEFVQQSPDVSEQATLDDKAWALLRPNPVKTIDFTCDPRLGPKPWDDYWIGDTVQFYARRGALVEGPLSVRVNQITVVTDPDTGLEGTEILDPVSPEEERVIRASLQTEVIV